MFFGINESSLKTVVFGLKPRKWLIFNRPVRQLADGVIDMRDNQGFSHIVKICGTFLDRTHKLQKPSLRKRNKFRNYLSFEFCFFWFIQVRIYCFIWK